MDIGVVPNFTILVQVAIFLAFIFIINTVYVKPYISIMERRKQIVRDNNEKAEKLKAEATAILEEAKALLDSAKNEATAILDSSKREASRIKAEIIDKAEKEAYEEIKIKVQEIRTSLEEEKKKMSRHIKKVAETIVSKLLREVA